MERVASVRIASHLHSVPNLAKRRQRLELGVTPVIDALVQVSVQGAELLICAAHGPRLALYTQRRIRET